MTMTISSVSKAPKVILDEIVYQKIMHWVNKSQYEVSGLGKLIVVDGVIRVIDAMLLPQKNSPTTTDIEAADIGKAAYLLRDTPGELRFWWHSHVNMAVFWSGTDVATMKLLAQGGWFVNTVFNKRNESKTCIVMNDPFPLWFDNCELGIERSVDAELMKEWDKEYDEKVKVEIPKLMPLPLQNWQGRFPRAQSHFPQTQAVFSPEERTELAKMAQQFMEDEDPRFPGLGADGVYGDEDFSSTLLSSGSELGKPTPSSVGDLLLSRDKLEVRIQTMTQRVEEYVSKDEDVPTRLARALETAESDLDEVEDELDTLEQLGILSAEDRHGAPLGLDREEA